jgi:hypothetical protein
LVTAYVTVKGVPAPYQRKQMKGAKILFHAVYTGMTYSQAREKLVKDSGLKDKPVAKKAAAKKIVKAPAVLRLDAANVLDDVRSKALERAPFKTFRTVGRDIFCCRIEAVRQRAAWRLWPEARPDIVGATAKQQIEALAIRSEDCISASGGPIGRGPVAVGEIAVITECWITPSSEMCSMILNFLI